MNKRGAQLRAPVFLVLTNMCPPGFAPRLLQRVLPMPNQMMHAHGAEEIEPFIAKWKHGGVGLSEGNAEITR